MAKASLRLSAARILVTNDDGINAPGLKVLEKIARQLSRDLAIPVYDAQVTGYPQRMRDWSSRQKQNRLD